MRLHYTVHVLNMLDKEPDCSEYELMNQAFPELYKVLTELKGDLAMTY
jgi:hypothetical protein